LSVAQPWDQASIDQVKDAAFGLHGGIGRLIQKPRKNKNAFS